MAYCDKDYLVNNGLIGEQALADLADFINSPGVITADATLANIAGAIAQADAEIDSYLRPVFSGDLPLTVPPQEIKSASAVLALYNLWAAKDRVSEVLENRRRTTILWLRDVARGVVALQLDDDDGGTQVPSSGIVTNKTADDRKFKVSDMWGRF